MTALRIAAVAACVGVLAGSAGALRMPGAPSCPVFPASSPWNRPVDALPLATNSATMIRSIGLGDELHADFGSGLWDGGPIGIPITYVPGTQPRSLVSFIWPTESDRIRYPIPANVAIEGGRASHGDRHAIIVDRDSCRLYELGNLYPLVGGLWRAGAGATWDLRSNRLRPPGWTSADAAGLPILPGLVRYDEVRRGVIDHALRFTAERTRRAFVYPARHFASASNSPALPPMGLRVRLRKNFDVSGFPPQARVVLVALKRYGMILADNGSNWFVSGEPNARWSNKQLRTLDRVKGADFQVVDARSLRPR
jgi:hypothetical protein